MSRVALRSLLLCVGVFGRAASGLLVPPHRVSGLSRGCHRPANARPGALQPRHVVIPHTVSAEVRGGVTQSLTLGSLWGVAGVMIMLLNAIKRVLPVALEPFASTGLPPPLWGIYGAFALGMAYTEGYKAFHKKFSPLVVARSMTLANSSPIAHSIFAPLYAMGLFHATPKRQRTSWGFLVGIFALVKLVKQLSYPWRSIVDGGVVVGLTIGSASIAYHYVRELRGIPSPANPDLP
ncbi:hypothetical protein CTAYLR_004790 [Chrysophaeum taylorii]|uniref:Phosphatidic acid phosphatase type 2/haloperoxidase domain-containing protein n=1 Tax=Chrysophaeum taylorii TaxID=2483200 RepID=A0AAD7UNA1_9STRA|nr:hypothetical protein CTAYLR_004790 [Chrysophaeum taylorii]